MRKQAQLTDIELILDRHSSLSDFETLVAEGCERQRLLDQLGWVFIVDSSWEHLLGNNLASLRKTVGDVRRCAALIEQLDKTRLIHDVTLEFEVPRVAALREGASLAKRLRMYANELERLPSAFGPRWKHMLNAWKARMCALVILGTGKFHDREVAAIISAVLEEEERQRPRGKRAKIRVRRKNPYAGYTEKAHQGWRLKNIDAINDFRESISSKILPPPSPPR
jgi:hypothetical protein